MRAIGILTKIWLSLSILIFGYFVSMIFGFFLGQQTESRLKSVSEELFPAATQSQLALTAFNEQIKLYDDVIMLGDKTILGSALTKYSETKNALQTVVKLYSQNIEIKKEINNVLDQLYKFTTSAQKVYAKMGDMHDEIVGEDSEYKNLMINDALMLGLEIKELRTKLTKLRQSFDDNLKAELADISMITKRQRYLNMIVFFMVVILGLSLVSLFINKAIGRPLKKAIMLEKAVEQTVDGIAVTNLDGEIDFINHAWAEMHGYQTDELTGKSMKLFHTEELFENEILPFSRKVIDIGSYSEEVWHKRKNGSIFPTMSTGNIITDKDNRALSMVFIARDITDRKSAEKALQKSEEKYKILTEVQQDVVLRVTKEGRIEYCSPAITEFGGYDHEKVVGSDIGQYFVIQRELINAYELINEIGVTRQFATIEFLFKPLDKPDFYVEVSGKPVMVEDKIATIQCVMRDISERKKVEKALQESLENLRSTQTQLVQSEKMAALGGLVAGVAHEINTPLGVGITAASFLGEKTQKYLKQYHQGKLKRSELEKYLDVASDSTSMILSNLNRAADLIRSFKQVAVDQSSEERRRFQLKEYIDEVLFSLKPRFKRTRHSISVACPENIELDSYPGVFSQIITNLVMNSIIHGFEGIEEGMIEFNIWKEEKMLVFCYSDNGRGMDRNTLEKSFDPFFTTNRSHGGTGLGMHILYNLVTQSLKGRMDYTSTPGKGVVFLIKVPLSVEQDEKAS